jgi:hypothetical protein
MAAAEQFGIKFGAGNLCSTMINPTNDQPISVFLDMSHTTISPSVTNLHLSTAKMKNKSSLGST